MCVRARVCLSVCLHLTRKREGCGSDTECTGTPAGRHTTTPHTLTNRYCVIKALRMVFINIYHHLLSHWALVEILSFRGEICEQEVDFRLMALKINKCLIMGGNLCMYWYLLINYLFHGTMNTCDMFWCLRCLLFADKSKILTGLTFRSFI